MSPMVASCDLRWRPGGRRRKPKDTIRNPFWIQYLDQRIAADTYENLLDPRIRKRFGEKIKVAGRKWREEKWRRPSTTHVVPQLVVVEV